MSHKILLCGKTGAGKSTLINYLVGREVAKESVGERGQTKEEGTSVYYAEGNLALYDAWGVEGDKVDEWIQSIKNINTEKDIDLYLYVVNSSTDRFESGEDKIIDKLTSDTKKDVIIVFSNACDIDYSTERKYKELVDNLNNNSKQTIKSVFVNSKLKEQRGENPINAYGKEDLIDCIMNLRFPQIINEIIEEIEQNTITPFKVNADVYERLDKNYLPTHINIKIKDLLDNNVKNKIEERIKNQFPNYQFPSDFSSLTPNSISINIPEVSKTIVNNNNNNNNNDTYEIEQVKKGIEQLESMSETFGIKINTYLQENLNLENKIKNSGIGGWFSGDDKRDRKKIKDNEYLIHHIKREKMDIELRLDEHKATLDNLIIINEIKQREQEQKRERERKEKINTAVNQINKDIAKHLNSIQKRYIEQIKAFLLNDSPKKMNANKKRNKYITYVILLFILFLIAFKSFYTVHQKIKEPAKATTNITSIANNTTIINGTSLNNTNLTNTNLTNDTTQNASSTNTTFF